MKKVFDYKLYELNSIRKRNIFIGIACFVVGFVVALLLLLLHNRSNSVIMSVFCIISIIIFSVTGLTFLLIFNAPISKLKQLVKKESNALTNDYFIEGIDNNVFAQDGIAFRKITLVNNENAKQVFYLEKSIDLGQDSMDIIEWTTKKAKEVIKNNPDYKYDGCSAAYAEGVAQFMPRNEKCLDTSIELPLIDFSNYGYISFYVTSAWVTAHLYVDDYYLGEVSGTSLALAKKFNIAITGSTLYVNGNYAYRLTSEQNNGLKPIKLRYKMDVYSKNADLCVSNISTRIVDHVALAKSYAESLDAVVLGGFNNVKTLMNQVASFNKYYALCNDFERTQFEVSEKVLNFVNSVKDSIYTVTYRIWGEVSSTEALLKEDILKQPAIEPQHKPFTFAYWGTSEGEYQHFNDVLTSDITLDAYYEYVSGADGQTKYAKEINTLRYYCFQDLNSYYGNEESTKAPSNPSLPEGYTFLRWTDNAETKEEFSFGSTIDDDVTLYAVAKDAQNNEIIFKTIYKVTFKDALGLGEDKIVDVFEEEKVNEIPGPVHGDDEFAYWAKDGEEFDFNTQIMEDVELVPYYWQESSDLTSYYETVYDIDKKMNDFAEVNPEDTTGWVPNSGSGQYMAIVSSGFIEFGLRKANTAEYLLNIPAFNFSEYKCVSFDIKNTWTATKFEINGIEINDGNNIGVNTVFKVIIRGNKLSVMISGVEYVLTTALDNEIVNGTKSLTIKAIDSTNGNGGGSFDIYNFLSYRNPVQLN